MANDKKGFILYADQKELFEQLPNDKAGELIKHIFAYVNDEEPSTDDLLIKLAFTPIKQQLKRDLKKFEATKLQRSNAGKRSAEVRKVQRDSTSVNTVQRSSTKATVTVNDTVNVTVNVNDILLIKETKELFKVWIDYRKEIKKPLKKQSQIALANKMNAQGFGKSKTVIESSIENGYQGLFWDKQQKQKETPGDLIDGYKTKDGKINLTAFDNHLKSQS